jgi:hypothetical protein
MHLSAKAVQVRPFQLLRPSPGKQSTVPFASPFTGHKSRATSFPCETILTIRIAHNSNEIHYTK